jgi:hypothetical protein
MYLYLYVSPHHVCICINVFVFDPHMMDCSDMYHTVYTVILVYRCNKQTSNVFLSVQFHTNVSQLVRDVFPGSYTPLASLGALPSNTLNRLHVCLSCLFWLCISLVCTVSFTVSPLSPSGLVFKGGKWSWFQRFFPCFFSKKNRVLTSKWTCVRILWYMLTSVFTLWREPSFFSPLSEQ